MCIRGIDIYETFHAGAVSSVQLLDPRSRQWDPVYVNPSPEDILNSRIFKPLLKVMMTSTCNLSRIFFDDRTCSCSRILEFCEFYEFCRKAKHVRLFIEFCVTSVEAHCLCVNNLTGNSVRNRRGIDHHGLHSCWHLV